MTDAKDDKDINTNTSVKEEVPCSNWPGIIWTWRLRWKDKDGGHNDEAGVGKIKIKCS